MKRLIKTLLIAILIATIIGSAFYYLGNKYKDEIYMYYRENILKVKDNIKLNKNKYYKDKDYKYVQNTNNFIAKDKKGLMNIFYTIINSGTASFTFYCDESYTDCTKDMLSIVEDKNILSNINNFVHPYNSFSNISTKYDEYGEITLEIQKLYSDEDIKELNTKVKEIIDKNIKKDMKDNEKIKTIHNYIINHGRYATDSIREKNKDKDYNKANDILIDGYGLCSAYSDAMALFLYEFGIDNYKIASGSHIWNLVYTDKKWLHLDLTWDDPITENGADKLETLFLLVDNDRLKELQVEKHDYDTKVYVEAK